MKGQEQQLRNEEKESEDQFRSRKDRVEMDFNGRKEQLVKERDHRLSSSPEKKTKPRNSVRPI